MLLDAEEMQPYLQNAFDHFACNLDTPFDFVQASFSYSPIPLDFGGNILKLAINLMEIWKNKADGRTIFVELSYMVASCIMLDSVRHKFRGSLRRYEFTATLTSSRQSPTALSTVPGAHRRSA